MCDKLLLCTEIGTQSLPLLTVSSNEVCSRSLVGNMEEKCEHARLACVCVCVHARACA